MAKKGIVLAGLAGLGLLFLATKQAQASPFLPEVTVIPRELPPEIAERPAVPVAVVGQTVQSTVMVTATTPIIATKEVYEAIAGRELTLGELAIMPPLVQLGPESGMPAGTIATYIPPLISPLVLDITDLQVVVTGRATGYAFRNYEIPPFVATVTVTVTADRDYSPSGIFLQGFGLMPDEEGPLPNTGITIPRGTSRYSWEVWIPVYVERAFSPTILTPGAPTGRYVVYGGGWGRFTISIVSGPGYQAVELQRKIFDRQATLKTQIEQMLGASIVIV